MKDETLLLSGISKNHCPFYARIAVRNQQESVSALRKNLCPEWTGITVRFAQEYAVEAYEDFLTKLNFVNEVCWIIILNDIRAELIKGVDPKQWPAYQKLILRVIQSDELYYNKDNF